MLKITTIRRLQVIGAALLVPLIYLTAAWEGAVCALREVHEDITEGLVPIMREKWNGQAD